ncbi:hypothetical protein PCANB_000666 [Pneumocystis canis]|nr:hypothetical protein PCK1_000744 [Pneumocystis canis]KAG5437629.1 hypothetical protein PCANB_000666 [Pneumocystis canis]
MGPLILPSVFPQDLHSLWYKPCHLLVDSESSAGKSQLDIDEAEYENKKRVIRSFGSTWIRPVGIQQTIHEQEELESAMNEDVDEDEEINQEDPSLGEGGLEDVEEVDLDAAIPEAVSSDQESDEFEGSFQSFQQSRNQRGQLMQTGIGIVTSPFNHLRQRTLEIDLVTNIPNGDTMIWDGNNSQLSLRELMEEQKKGAIDDNDHQVQDLDEKVFLEQKIYGDSGDDILEDIVPDHYYDNGKIPVFKPTMEQFHCFMRFVKSINSYGMTTGIVKIIPPNEWLEKLPDYTEKVKSIRLKNPIEQHIVGNGGCFRQTNVEKRQIYNLPKWRKLCESSDHLPPARRGEIRKTLYSSCKYKKSKNIPSTTHSSTSELSYTNTSVNDLTEGDQEKEEVQDTVENNNGLIVALSYKSSPEKEETMSNHFFSKTDFDNNIKKTEKKTENIEDSEPSKKKNKKLLLKNMNKINQTDHYDFEGFDYKITNAEEYTIERCKELERIYWKTITYNNPLYGADMPGSLFDDSVKEWNVANLDNILNKMGVILPGVNTSYLYLGMWKATFSWHVEDMDLYSINYLHFGAPKQWYSICQKDASRFENIMRRIFPNDYKICSQFLRHKTFSVSPSVLAQNNIYVNRLVQHQGEFVITFPYGYHSGYNLGYNCAESVNFASHSWLDIGRNAKRCNCIPDSVHINVDDALKRIFSNDEEKQEPKKRKTYKKMSPELKQLKKLKISQHKKSECCILCPNKTVNESLISTSCGNLSHRICALYIPETYIKYDTELSKDVVYGVDVIEKARFRLRCMYCRSIKGACFQCSYTKCVRSYHATCAASAGVLVETFQSGSIQQFFFSCKFHRPKRPKPEKLEDDPHIYKFAAEVAIGDVIQAQYTKGDIFSGIVRENRVDENIVLIEISSHDLYEVEYKWILAPPLRILPLHEMSDSNNNSDKINNVLFEEKHMSTNIPIQENNNENISSAISYHNLEMNPTNLESSIILI